MKSQNVGNITRLNKFLPILISIFFGILCLRVITENDLFLQIRAGAEILQNHLIQRTDSWSHTNFGHNWLNYQWLSCVLFSWLSRWSSDYQSLVFFRAAIVSGLFYILHIIIRDSVFRNKSQALPDQVLLSPILFGILSGWLEMRPGLLSYVTYAGILLIWLRTRNYYKAFFSSLFIVVALANFHGGLTPILLPLQLGFMFFHPTAHRIPLLQKFFFTILQVSSWLFSPIGIEVIKSQFNIIYGLDWKVTENPDMASFRWVLLDPSFASYAYWVWIGWTASGLIAIWKEVRGPRFLNPAFPLPLASGLFVLHTLATFAKIRLLPYHLIISLPLMVAGLNHLRATLVRKKWVFTCLGVGLGILFIFHTEMYWFTPEFGLTPSKYRYPIESVKFLREAKPRGELCNNTNMGGYLIHQLPEYRVSSDTRNDLYAHTDQALLSAKKDPLDFAKILQEWNCNIAIEAHQPIEFIPGQEWVDPYQIYYSNNNWALVQFDSASQVFLRRIPEHSALIQQYEYHCLRPNLPFNFIARSKKLSPSQQAECETELDQCLKRNPENNYCLGAKGVLLKLRGSSDARIFLEKAKRLGLHNSMLDLELSELEL